MANLKSSRLYIDVSLMAITVIGALLYNVIIRHIYYNAGLTGVFNRNFAMTLLSIVGVAWLVLIVRCIIIMKFGVKRLLLQIFFIVIPISLNSIMPRFVEDADHIFTEGFLERMKKEAEVPKIQAWLDTLDLVTLKEFEKDESGWWIDNAKWPDVLKKFSHHIEDIDYVLLKKSKNDRIYVRIMCGGTWAGFYGLVVGVCAEEIPLNDFNESEYRLELAPNAFVWRRLKRTKGDSATSKSEESETEML